MNEPTDHEPEYPEHHRVSHGAVEPGSIKEASRTVGRSGEPKDCTCGDACDPEPHRAIWTSGHRGIRSCPEGNDATPCLRMLERNGHLCSNVGLDGFDLVNSQEILDVIIPRVSHHYPVNEIRNWTLWPTGRTIGDRPSATRFHDVSPAVRNPRTTAPRVFGIGANPHARHSSEDV